MRKQKPIMPVEDHLIVSKKLHQVHELYGEMSDILHKYYGKTNPIMKNLYKVLLTAQDKHRNEMKNLLDEEWCRVATEEEFNKYGFAYYDKRGFLEIEPKEEIDELDQL